MVVDSLQGQTAREFAIGIGNSWGVGKADRDNGIVLLWAPNERSYSLRIAEGLSQELNDADATDITRRYLVPNFRREDYYEGLKETVEAVTRKLGNQSWDERVRTRQEGTWLAPALIAGVGIVVVLAVTLYRARKRRLKLREMATAPGLIERSLRVAEQNAPEVHQLLDHFKKEIPEQDVTRLSADLEGQPSRITAIRTGLGSIDFSDLASYTRVLQLKDRADEERDLIRRTVSKLKAIRQSKAKCQVMIQRLGEEKFQIGDLRDESQRSKVTDLLSNGRSLYDRAYQDSSGSFFDWMVINELLDNSQRQVDEAVRVSQEPPYPPPPVFDSGSSSTFDTSSFGSGADVGGGGGFDGGSGSDGSY